jgi:hypothetical protein
MNWTATPCRVHWSVIFATDDTDATAAKATELGGTVIVPPFDAPWSVGRPLSFRRRDDVDRLHDVVKFHCELPVTGQAMADWLPLSRERRGFDLALPDSIATALDEKRRFAWKAATQCGAMRSEAD